MPTLADTRNLTLADAEALLENLALLECEMAILVAECESKIAELKSQHSTRANPISDQIAAAAARLSQFILANPEEFASPRARVTNFGKFGRRHVSNVDLIDEDATIKWARSLTPPATDVLREKVSLSKPALRKRLLAGTDIPGVELLQGEEAFYKIDPSLIKNALDEA